MKRKIIIDTDCCFDDIIAMSLALKNKKALKILGITIVSGCVLLEEGIYAPYIIIDLFNFYRKRIYPGNNKSLLGNVNPAPELCGENGFGTLKVKKPQIKIHKKSYINFLYKTLKKHPNEIEIVCLGPLTNIAKLFTQYPDAVNLIKELHIMGTTGTIQEGNETDYAEYNIWTDVEAAKIVFDTKVNKKIMGWDISVNNPISGIWLDKYKNSKKEFLKFLYDITELPRQYTLNLTKKDEVNMVDQFVISYLIDSSIAEFKKARINITTEKGIYYGKSNLNFNSDNPNCELCIKFDLNKSLRLLESFE